jgi:hypothetical protein
LLACEPGKAQDPLVGEVIAHEIGLHTEDELSGKTLRACLH